MTQNQLSVIKTGINDRLTLQHVAAAPTIAARFELAKAALVEDYATRITLTRDFTLGDMALFFNLSWRFRASRHLTLTTPP